MYNINTKMLAACKKKRKSNVIRMYYTIRVRKIKKYGLQKIQVNPQVLELQTLFCNSFHFPFRIQCINLLYFRCLTPILGYSRQNSQIQKSLSIIQLKIGLIRPFFCKYRYKMFPRCLHCNKIRFCRKFFILTKFFFPQKKNLTVIDFSILVYLLNVEIFFSQCCLIF